MDSVPQPRPRQQSLLFDAAAPPLNRHLAAVEQESVQWVLRFLPDLAGDPKRLQKMRAGKFANLGARGLPRIDHDELRYVTDFLTWLFFYDDGLCDDVAGQGDALARLLAVQDRMLATLRGEAPQRHDSHLVHMLADLRDRTIAWSDPPLVAKFFADIERYFQSNVWELHNHLRKTPPPAALYLKMRPIASACPVVFDLIEVVSHQPLHAAREHMVMQQYELLANNCICWANDIHSLDKELLEGNPHNLVQVLAHDHRLSMTEATQRAAEMLAAEEVAFAALGQQLHDFAGLQYPHVRAFAADLRSFVRGNVAWMRETMRYRACLSMQNYGAAA